MMTLNNSRVPEDPGMHNPDCQLEVVGGVIRAMYYLSISP